MNDLDYEPNRERESTTFDVNGYTITIVAPVGVNIAGGVSGELEIVGLSVSDVTKMRVPVYTTLRWSV